MIHTTTATAKQKLRHALSMLSHRRPARPRWACFLMLNGLTMDVMGWSITSGPGRNLFLRRQDLTLSAVQAYYSEPTN